MLLAGSTSLVGFPGFGGMQQEHGAAAVALQGEAHTGGGAASKNAREGSLQRGNLCTTCLGKQWDPVS